MREATASAPGKVILVGEHAVVYNHPAIAIPVHGVKAEATVAVRETPGVDVHCPDLAARAGGLSDADVAPFADLARRVLAMIGQDDIGLDVCLRSTIPVRRGMGSGAALSVALIRAIAAVFDHTLPLNVVIDMAYETEKVFHGNPSGIDNNVVARDEPVYFTRRHGCQAIRPGRTEFHFLIADTGVPSATHDVVADLARRRGEHPARYDSVLWEIGNLASCAREVISRGTPAQLGACMRRNHELLRDIEISCDPIERLVAAAEKAGSAGAKLSGAGRGGNVLVLLTSGNAHAEVSHALLEAGAREIYPAILN